MLESKNWSLSSPDKRSSVTVKKPNQIVPKRRPEHLHEKPNFSPTYATTSDKPRKSSLRKVARQPDSNITSSQTHIRDPFLDGKGVKCFGAAVRGDGDVLT